MNLLLQGYGEPELRRSGHILRLRHARYSCCGMTFRELRSSTTRARICASLLCDCRLDELHAPAKLANGCAVPSGTIRLRLMSCVRWASSAGAALQALSTWLGALDQSACVRRTVSASLHGGCMVRTCDCVMPLLDAAGHILHVTEGSVLRAPMQTCRCRRPPRARVGVSTAARLPPDRRMPPPRAQSGPRALSG
jgi:hypothetical protein